MLTACVPVQSLLLHTVSTCCVLPPRPTLVTRFESSSSTPDTSAPRSNGTRPAGLPRGIQLCSLLRLALLISASCTACCPSNPAPVLPLRHEGPPMPLRRRAAGPARREGTGGQGGRMLSCRGCRPRPGAAHALVPARARPDRRQGHQGNPGRDRELPCCPYGARIRRRSRTRGGPCAVTTAERPRPSATRPALPAGCRRSRAPRGIRTPSVLAACWEPGREAAAYIHARLTQAVWPSLLVLVQESSRGRGLAREECSLFRQS